MKGLFVADVKCHWSLKLAAAHDENFRTRVIPVTGQLRQTWRIQRLKLIKVLEMNSEHKSVAQRGPGPSATAGELIICPCYQWQWRSGNNAGLWGSEGLNVYCQKMRELKVHENAAKEKEGLKKIKEQGHRSENRSMAAVMWTSKFIQLLMEKYNYGS